MHPYLALAALVLFAVPTFAAETRYVSDELVITMRTGKGNAYQILRTLPSGTPLEVLEEEGEFVYVRTKLGTEGWVRSQYLVMEPIARDQLAAAQQKNQQLGEEVRSLREQLRELTSERDGLRGALEESERTGSALKEKVQELEQVAATPIRLSQENAFMKSRIGSLEEEVKRVNGVNEELRKGEQRQWFVIGAAVAGAGILIGLILPHLRSRRRSNGWG